MPWYEWILSILLFIVSLGALITIHEAGHFSMAKLFKVYCHEFSIGFGPAILHKRKEGKETYFSIRAIPLGGYVSMYGEDGQELEEGLTLPPERSIEGIKKWKKAIILSAGVILNAILALVLIGVSNIAFPIIGMTRSSIVATDSIAMNAGIKDGDNIEFAYGSSQITEDGGLVPYTYEYTDDEKIIHGGQFYIVDTNVAFTPEGASEEQRYVLAFMFTGNKDIPNFTEGLKLYQAVKKEDLSGETLKMFESWTKEENAPDYYPDFTKTTYKLSSSTKFDATLRLTSIETKEVYNSLIHFETVTDGSKSVLKDIGLSLATRKVWLDFGTRVKNTFIDYGNASVAVFKGLGVLFTGGIRNMSGFVGIFETSASLFRNYTFATYLYFWGMISVNLAIFNLLPFPGLDGWQLLVTAIEGITKKKIPSKFKSIMSFIGLALLFMLMIAIVVFDVMRIVGA